MKINKEQYEFARAKIEALLPVVTDEMPVYDDKAVILSQMSDIVIAYEKEYFPIRKPDFLHEPD